MRARAVEGAHVTAPGWLIAAVLALCGCEAPFTVAEGEPGDGGTMGEDVRATETAPPGSDAASLPDRRRDEGGAVSEARALDAGTDVLTYTAPPDAGACTLVVECMSSPAGAVCEAPWVPCAAAEARPCGLGTTCCAACL